MPVVTTYEARDFDIFWSFGQHRAAVNNANIRSYQRQQTSDLICSTFTVLPQTAALI